MALYRFVWDPDGVPFEVSPEKAADLVLNQGWSNVDPASRWKNKVKKKTENAKTEAPVADTTEVNDVAGEAPAAATSE